VLLIHSRLRDEYLASQCFTNIRIVIRANFWGRYLLEKEEFSTGEHALATAAISHAHHITLYVEVERDDGPDGR
jgi:hypothetical protein